VWYKLFFRPFSFSSCAYSCDIPNRILFVIHHPFVFLCTLCMQQTIVLSKNYALMHAVVIVSHIPLECICLFTYYAFFCLFLSACIFQRIDYLYVCFVEMRGNKKGTKMKVKESTFFFYLIFKSRRRRRRNFFYQSGTKPHCSQSFWSWIIECLSFNGQPSICSRIGHVKPIWVASQIGGDRVYLHAHIKYTVCALSGTVHFNGRNEVPLCESGTKKN
jgi:hypothetical protein